MDRIIGVENNLTPVKEYLAQKGYKIEDIDFGKGEYTKSIDRFDAIVVTGMNTDFLGVQDTVSKIPVINARGLTKEDVYQQLSSKFEQ